MRRATCPGRNLPGRASRAIKRHQVTPMGCWLKFVDRIAENDSWHGRYALEFCPLADKYASEDHSSMRIPRELSRAVLRINIEGSGKGRGGQVAQAIIRYDCVRPRSNYMFSATIINSRYRCRYPQPRKRS